jgi:hypothetical protein
MIHKLSKWIHTDQPSMLHFNYCRSTALSRSIWKNHIVREGSHVSAKFTTCSMRIEVGYYSTKITISISLGFCPIISSPPDIIWNISKYSVLFQLVQFIPKSTSPNSFLPQFDFAQFWQLVVGIFLTNLFVIRRSSCINFRIIYPPWMACSKKFHKLSIPRADVHCDVDRERRNLPELYDFSSCFPHSPSFLSILASCVSDGRDNRAIFSSFLGNNHVSGHAS